MVAQDEEVDEINYQLTEDDGELVPRNEHAADVRRSHLADIHRANGRSQTHADTANDTVKVEHNQQRIGGNTMLEEQEFRVHAAQRGDEEQQTGNDERFLTSEIRGQVARKSGTDDTADKG